MHTDTLDTTEYRTRSFEGGQLEWAGEPYDENFGFSVKFDAKDSQHYSTAEFWAELVDCVPEGAVYHDGFLICFSFADMKTLMDELQTRYDRIESYVAHSADKGWY